MFNIVMVVLDSVRSANCSLYGYGRRTNPKLEKLAPEFVVYKNAFSTTISTVPAHASLFTGTHVSTHGLFVEGHRLTGALVTLAEFLSGLGYSTFGICYQDDVSPVTGLHRGFGEFHMDDEPPALKKLIRSVLWRQKILEQKQGLTAPGTSPAGKGLISRLKDSMLFQELYWAATRNSDQGAASSRKKIERYLSRITPGSSFFMYVHYDEAHLPYRPPSPYRHAFSAGNGNGKRPVLVNQDRTRFFIDPGCMDEEDFQVLRALYDGSILYLDSMVADVYEMLRKRGMLENTMFIVLADHGDHLGEHGLMSHKYSLCDHLIKVPMMIKYPAAVGRRGVHEGIVQITDIFPTIADALGLPDGRIPSQLEGGSLLSRRFPGRGGEYAVAELMKPFGRDIDRVKRLLRRYDRKMYAVRGPRYKLIRDAGGGNEIYDLAEDPGESRAIERSGGLDGIEIGILRLLSASHLPRFQSCNQRFAMYTG